MAQSIVYVFDANGNKQPLACVPVTWNGVAGVNMQAVMPVPWNVMSISVSGVTVVKGSQGLFGGIRNIDPNNAQAFEIQGWDNASTNSGKKVMDVRELAIGDKYDWPPGGVEMDNGIVVYCYGNPTGLIALWL